MPKTINSAALDTTLPTAVLPPAEELATWVCLLACIHEELTEEAEPIEPGSKAAVIRAGQLASMRLWLTGAYRIALVPETGEVISNDPDLHPIG